MGFYWYSSWNDFKREMNEGRKYGGMEQVFFLKEISYIEIFS